MCHHPDIMIEKLNDPEELSKIRRSAKAADKIIDHLIEKERILPSLDIKTYTKLLQDLSEIIRKEMN